ncbi:MAG: hypothetical protein ABI772_05650 [Bacteroidota bacterium]
MTIKNIMLFLLVLNSFESFAQDKSKLQVVTHEVVKTITNKNILSLYIDGNKANVTIKGWSKQETMVKFTFIAKHADKSVAENDVKSFAYTLEEAGSKLEIGTTINHRKKKSGKTIMKCEIEIFTPVSNDIRMENSFANITIENMNSGLDINAKYGTLNLNNITGSCEISCYYNDVTATNINIDLHADFQNSNFNADGVTNGTYSIKGNFCNTEMLNIESVKKINFKIDNGTIELQLLHPLPYKYDIRTQAGQISNYLPDALKKKAKNTTYEFSYKPATQTGDILINCLYSNIKLK